MRKYACVHTFLIEASDRQEFDARLTAYRAKVDQASARLDIGYVPGHMMGQIQPDHRPEAERVQIDEGKLFDV